MGKDYKPITNKIKGKGMLFHIVVEVWIVIPSSEQNQASYFLIKKYK